MTKRAIAGLVLPLLMAACGGSAATPATTTAPATVAPPTVAPASEAPATEAPASIAPGTIAYRVVNASSGPVDVYIRTQGLVTAAPAAMAVAPGAVTLDFFPPEPGTVVVLKAGSGDPTCVSGCSFLGESSTNAGEGDRRILVVGSDGTASEYWENADAASIGTVANALPAADPANPLLVIEAGGVSDADFGLNVGFDGANGCAADVTGGALMLGGTNVLAYVMDPAGVKVAVHDSTDRACATAPVGGPFPVPAAAAGSRTFLLLWGKQGSIDGLAIPLS